MSSMGMTGAIIFNDILGVVNNGPILGGEEVFLRWKSTTYTEWTELRMRVSMLVAQEPTNQANSISRLEICSEALYFGRGKELSRGFRGQYSEIASQLWAETGINVPFAKDSSLGQTTLVTSTHLDVIETLRWMASRARTQDNLPFVFFEDFDGLNFASMSGILNQAGSVPLVHQPQTTEEDIRKEWMNILAVQTEDNTRDALGFMESGIGKTREIIYRVETKSVEETQHNFDDVVSGFGLNEGKVSILGSDKTDATDFYIHRSDGSESNVHERDSINWLLQYSGKTICNHGDDRARLGQVIEVNFYSPQATSANTIPREQFFSGKYLVTSIKDTIRPNEYRTYRGLSQETLKREVK